MATPRFELYEKAGWRWRLVDVNGRIVASSFRYASKTSAKQAAQKAKDNAAAAEIVDARPSIDVTAVAGEAFGGSVAVRIEGVGPITFPPTPTVTLASSGGSQNKTVPKSKVGPGGLFLTSGVLHVSSRGGVGPSGSVTSTADVNDTDLLAGTLIAASLRSTCTANETGASGSTAVRDGILVLDENQIVPLPAVPAPNTTYEGTNAQTGDTFSVVLNEQVVTPGGITVIAVHVVLHGPTATGEIVLASSQAGVTTSAG